MKIKSKVRIIIAILSICAITLAAAFIYQTLRVSGIRDIMRSEIHTDLIGLHQMAEQLERGEEISPTTAADFVGHSQKLYARCELYRAAYPDDGISEVADLTNAYTYLFLSIRYYGMKPELEALNHGLYSYVDFFPNYDGFDNVEGKSNSEHFIQRLSQLREKIAEEPNGSTTPDETPVNFREWISYATNGLTRTLDGLGYERLENG